MYTLTDQGLRDFFIRWLEGRYVVREAGKALSHNDLTDALKADVERLIDASTLHQYGITDAYTKDEIDDIASALGSAITALDFYTQDETDDLVSDAIDDAIGDLDFYTQSETERLISDAIAVLDFYTKGESDRLISDAIAALDVYTKGESDSIVRDAINSLDFYTKGETDTAIRNAISAIDAYTKRESDALIGGKVDKVPGKALSTNDFTDELKNTLEDLAAGADGQMRYRGEVTYAQLQRIQDARVSDVYRLSADAEGVKAGDKFMWTGSAWEGIGSSSGLSLDDCTVLKPSDIDALFSGSAVGEEGENGG